VLRFANTVTHFDDLFQKCRLLGSAERSDRREPLGSELGAEVLSGNGDLNSALKIAQRLKKMAYKMTRIDSAPRSDFSRNTVFFARNVESQGRRLVASLGGQTICKPLSWHSAFDLMVVIGKNP
jgi:hypothetical protein